MVIIAHQNLSLGKSWKLLTATLIYDQVNYYQLNLNVVFSRSYGCYGIPLSHENGNNVFNNDSGFFLYHDCSIN